MGYLNVKKKTHKSKEKESLDNVDGGKKSDNDKENSKKLKVKIKTKKKRKKIEDSSSDEDILEEQIQKKKRIKNSSPPVSPEANFPDVEKVVEVPKADVIV